MTNNNKRVRKSVLRKALFSSAISLILCCAMLVGTTFAWFTDTVTSSNNIIKSGTLDVTMEWADSEAEFSSGELISGKWIDASKGAIFNYDLWEPGYTEVRHIKIANEGTLALKYYLNIIANGEVSALADVIDVYFFDPANTLSERADLPEENKIGTLSNILKAMPTNTNGELLKGESDTITIALKMQETAGNEYQNKSIGTDFSVQLLATQLTYEEDSFDHLYDENAKPVITANEAQVALDNAVAGTTIRLAPGVNYGTLYIRPVAGNANTVTDCDYLVYRNEMLRKVENLTIVGAPGATVDAIKVVAGYVADSGSTGYVVDIKNLVIDSVEFTDKHTNAPHSYAAPIFFDLSYTNVDGLTVKNCKLIGDNEKMNFVYLYGSGNPSNSTFVTAAKNFTITNNTVDGIARLCELRQTENVTITNNTIKNTALHGILLPVDGGTYSGNVTITGNTADGIKERFVRMAGAGSANVVIKDNTITNYKGADSDYIKVTDSTGTSVIENNPMSVYVSVSNAADLSAAVNSATGNADFNLAAGNYTLPGVSNKDVSFSGTKETVITIDKPGFNGNDVTLNGVTIQASGNYTGIQHVNNVTYNDVTINGSMNLYGEEVVFNNCEFNLNGDYIWTYGAKVVEFNNCTFNTTGKAILVYNEGAGASDVTVKNCVFNATAGAKAGAIANQNCAAIEIDNFQNSGVGTAHKLTTSGNTYSENFSGEWRIKNFVAGNAITVNGTDYTQIALDGKLMTIDTEKNVTVQ